MTSKYEILLLFEKIHKMQTPLAQALGGSSWYLPFVVPDESVLAPLLPDVRNPTPPHQQLLHTNHSPAYNGIATISLRSFLAVSLRI